MRLPVPATAAATTTATAATATLATATTTAATATPTAALLSWLSFVDSQVTTVVLLLIQSLYRGRTFLRVGHLYKGEPAGTPRIPIRDDVHFSDFAIGLK